jgi:hypothetical protein
MPELFSLHEYMTLMYIIKFLQRHRRFQRKFHTSFVRIQHRMHVHHCKNYQMQTSISSPVQKKFESGITRILSKTCSSLQELSNANFNSSRVQKKFEAGITRILSKTLTFKWLANEVHSTYRTPRRQMLPPHLQLPKQLQQSRIQTRRDTAKFSTALN